jgi:hypothetical protein
MSLNTSYLIYHRRCLDKEFSHLLAKIQDRNDQLKLIEEKLGILDKGKEHKRDSLRSLERKLVSILEAQEKELSKIRSKQDEQIDIIAETGAFPHNKETRHTNQRHSEKNDNSERTALLTHEKKQAVHLMDSTETMMKFGFMSMAMTYFTSMNMVGAMKNISRKDTCSLDGREMNSNLEQIVHLEKRSKQHDSNVLKWDIDNVIEWLSVIHLVQYAPISIISSSFILNILVPSSDSLSSVGFNFVEDGKKTYHDLTTSLISMADSTSSVMPLDGIISKRTLNKLLPFASQMKKLKQKAELRTVSDLLGTIIERLDLKSHFNSISKTNDEFADRWANVNALRSASERYSKDGPCLTQSIDEETQVIEMSPLGNFLDDVSLLSDVENNTEDEKDGERRLVVNLITIHASKGMEFDCVFLVENEEGTIPTQRSISDGDGKLQCISYHPLQIITNISTSNSSIMWIFILDSRRVNSTESFKLCEPNM